MVAWFEKKIIRQATTITIGLESGSLCFGSRFEFGACVKAHLGHFAPVVFVASEDFFFFFLKLNVMLIDLLGLTFLAVRSRKTG